MTLFLCIVKYNKSETRKIMATLLINAHPDYTNTETTTHALMQQFIAKHHAIFPNEQLTMRNLYHTQIPRIETNQLLTIWDKQTNETSLSPSEQKLSDTSLALLEQFKTHDKIVIVSPLHNFNITSRLKDYLDNILIAKETFAYTDDGSIGLMQGHKALFLQASGCVYTDGGRYANYDYAYHYLKDMFEGIMGFDNFAIVRAEGTDVNNKGAILAESTAALESAFANFYA